MLRLVLITLLLTFASHQTAEANLFCLPKFLTEFFKKDEPKPVYVQPAKVVGLVKVGDPVKNVAALENSRQELIDAMIKGKIPGFIKTTNNGAIPVVLVNSKTYKKLAPHMKNSVGSLIMLQPDHTNDHGLLRVAENIIDVDSPGKRGFGEINKTGLTWKNVANYLKRRHENSYVLVEVAYKVTDKELLTMDYYQRVRRAAIIRVPFTFDGVPPEKGLNNLLRSGEHCFVFSKCSAVDSHISEMKQKIETLSKRSSDKVMNDPEVQAFLNGTREKILAHLANDLSPFLYTEDAVAVKNNFFKELSEKDANEAINWIIGLDASLKYQEVTKSLGIPSSGGFNNEMANSKATAVFIYDDPINEKKFLNATYSTEGKSVKWNNDNQKRIPY